MNTAIIIRPEIPADIPAISAITEAAFATLEVSHHTEQHIITALRAAGALAVSLVAVREGQVVGHIALSPVSLSDGSRDWYGLGPVSVLPEHQRKGIGSELIEEALGRLRQMGAQGCCLVGHPGYYTRFGFRNTPSLGIEGVPAEVFFALPFGHEMPQAQVKFHEAFTSAGQIE